MCLTETRFVVMRRFRILLYFLFISTVLTSPLPKKYKVKRYLEEPAVKKFREYLKIDTSREENLKYAVQFWKREATELGLYFTVYEPAGKPICVMTWEGIDPSLPSIMLNSHMDVVTAEESRWIYPPFSAHMDETGDIYGRGAQDTKDIAIQYIEAIRKLKQDNVTLLRTLHVTLMPDEETGGYNGIKPFLETQEFNALNVGFALDEGLSSSDDSVYVIYQDKRPWQIKITVYGEGGHGSTMPDDSAMVKTKRLMDRIMEFRNQQRAIMKSKSSLDFGAYSSVNINMVNAGTLPNVIPDQVTIVIDIRLASSATSTEMDSLIKSWLAETGNTTKIEFIRREDNSAVTWLDGSNAYWKAVEAAFNDRGINIHQIVCPATSDMLVLRNRGIPAMGFAPKTNTISRIHGENEYLNVETFLEGIDVYVDILKNLGNVS